MVIEIMQDCWYWQNEKETQSHCSQGNFGKRWAKCTMLLLTVLCYDVVEELFVMMEGLVGRQYTISYRATE